MADCGKERQLGYVRDLSTDIERAMDHSRSTTSNLEADKSPPESRGQLFHYHLGFDTELPTIPHHYAQHSLPPPPDLSAYGSPLEWAPARKRKMLALACAATLSSAYAAGSYAPPAGLIAADLNSSRVTTLAGITTFCAGFGLAPMALAPMSEVLGRYLVFVISSMVFVVFEVVCSVVPSLAGMLVARFFVGVGGSVYSSVVGGVIADIWIKEERNTPMALFSGFVLAGTGAGPLVSTVLVDRIPNGTLAWKWSFWHQIIFNVVLMLFIIVLFKESRASVLLNRKAQKLNAWYDELEKAGVYKLHVRRAATPLDEPPYSSSSSSLPEESGVDGANAREKDDPGPFVLRRLRFVVREDGQRASVGRMIATSVRRPFYLLFTEPVVFFFALWAAFSWGILYLSFAVVPYLYDRNLDKSSRTYVAMIAAAVVATIAGIWQERLLRHPQWRARETSEDPYSDSRLWAFMRRNFPAESPEARLYFACVTTMLVPAGLYVAFLTPASTNDYSIAVGIGFAIWGIYSVYLASFNYLADTYPAYASSVLAAQSFCRNALGGCFPLITGAMFSKLGLSGAGGILGGIAAVLTATPWVLVFFGERIRARSKFAVSLQQRVQD